jgi:metal-responsive CopG/Arc/MetJ family transcriptional regulator
MSKSELSVEENKSETVEVNRAGEGAFSPTPNEAAKRIREVVVVSFKVPGDMLLELDAAAEKLGVDRSWVIRGALSWFAKNSDVQKIYKGSEGSYGGKLHIITFKAPQPFVGFVDELASSLDMSRSELIRRALAMYLDYMAKSERKNGFIVKEGVVRI